MKFFEVSPVKEGVLQEWHCGQYILTVNKTDRSDRFKVQMHYWNELLQPEFILLDRASAKKATDVLIEAYRMVAIPAASSVINVLKGFASAHSWADGYGHGNAPETNPSGSRVCRRFDKQKAYVAIFNDDPKPKPTT